MTWLLGLVACRNPVELRNDGWDAGCEDGERDGEADGLADGSTCLCDAETPSGPSFFPLFASSAWLDGHGAGYRTCWREAYDESCGDQMAAANCTFE